jgi:hypothetical protein
MNFAPAILYAVSSSTLLALALGFVRGGLNPSSAGLAVGFGLLVAAADLWRGRAQQRATVPPTAWEWAAIVAFTLVAMRIFLWVVFVEGDEIKVLSPNNLGDLSLHLTYIRYLQNGAPFWPENPIFSGAPLTYPIGVDFVHSLLVLLGMDALRGFVWIGLIGSALTGAALWRWGRGFALFGFLANGGLAALTIFSTGALADFQAEFAWKSFALALFATQRGFLFAFPAGLLLLSSWRARFFGDSTGEGILPRSGEVLLYASLPLFHFHTFLFLSVLLAAWFVTHAPARRALLMLVGAAFVPATILVWLVTGGLQGGHMLGWKPGWMWDDAGFLTWCREHLGEPERLHAAVLFWPMNFGMLPVLVAALVIVVLRERDAWARAVVLPALGVFLVCCFVKFAPWEWDNTKLMVWSYLAVLPFLWSKLLVRWPEWARGAMCVALFGSGFLSTLGGIDGTHRGHAIASRLELDGTAQAVRAIPITERFAGAPTYNHPLLLCGRKMVLGYLGHVASHGLAWEEPAAKLDALMRGGPDWLNRAAELEVRYLFWGRYEDQTYQDSPQPWREEARLVASGEWGAIYDLFSPPSATPELPNAPE